MREEVRLSFNLHSHRAIPYMLLVPATFSPMPPSAPTTHGAQATGTIYDDEASPDRI